MARGDESILRGRGSVLPRVVVVVWVLLVVSGMGVLIDYSSAPGVPAAAPESWPETSRIPREPGKSTLVVLAHPKCPCSRASIAELARLMAQVPGQVDAHVLFLEPNGSGADGKQSDLRDAAGAIPGVRVHGDPHGAEARAFGAATSGQALLYDPSGRLVFAGGITESRGHEGDNFGRDAIVARLRGSESDPTTAPVFGCSLHDPSGSQEQRSEPS
jgi:hypothetical protein